MTLLEVISRDTALRKVASTDGGEYHGPCPFCGGRDRFVLWPHSDRPYYWCRQCERRGDAIQFLRDREGLSYREACQRLNLPLDERSHLRSKQAAQPQPPPLAAAPCQAWQTKAQAFIQICERALWSPAGADALAYLRRRGLYEDILREAHVGVQVTDQYESRQAWGVAATSTRQGGAPRPAGAGEHDWHDAMELPPVPERKELWLPRGIVFPWSSGSMLWRVTFRQLAPRGTDIRHLGQVDGDSHHTLRGSANTLYGIDSVRPDAPAMLVEAPLNALSLAQEAGDLVAVVAAGGTSGGRLERWIGRLALTSMVLLAFDADEAGEAAAAWWLKALGSRAKRWRPYWDDPNAMLQNGIDLRTWIHEGLGQEPYWWRDMAAWSDERREAWAERAAILEVEAGFVRHEAELTAFLMASRAARSM